MRLRVAWLATALTFMALPPADALDHLVAPGTAQATAAAAAAERGRDREALAAVLTTPEARGIAAGLGLNADDLSAASATLSDAELEDLAARARLLDQDPVAGNLDPTIRQLLIIFLIVAIVILVLQAVD